MLNSRRRTNVKKYRAASRGAKRFSEEKKKREWEGQIKIFTKSIRAKRCKKYYNMVSENCFLGVYYRTQEEYSETMDYAATFRRLGSFHSPLNVPLFCQQAIAIKTPRKRFYDK